MDKLGGPRISLADTSTVVCEACGGKVFEQAVMIQKVSALMTGTGQPGIIPIPVFMCSKCGHVNAEFLPQELKDGNTESKL